MQVLVAAWEPVRSLTFSPRGELFACFSVGVYLWPNPGAGGPPTVLPFPERERFWERQPRRVHFTPDGNTFLLDGVDIQLYDRVAGHRTPLAVRNPSYHDYAAGDASPDGRLALFTQGIGSQWNAPSRIICQSVSDPSNDLWRVEDGRLVVGLCALADNERVFSIEQFPDEYSRYFGVLRDLRTGGRLTEELLPADACRHTRPYSSLTAAADRSRMAVFDGDAAVVFDPLDLAAPPTVLPAHRRKPGIVALAFYPAADLLATTGDAAVRFVNLRTKKVARTYDWNLGHLQSLAFSPDGTLAAAGTDTGQIVVWDVDV